MIRLSVAMDNGGYVQIDLPHYFAILLETQSPVILATVQQQRMINDRDVWPTVTIELGPLNAGSSL